MAYVRVTKPDGSTEVLHSDDALKLIREGKARVMIGMKVPVRGKITTPEELLSDSAPEERDEDYIALQRHCDALRDENARLRSFRDGDYWMWQGDGEDHVESMGEAQVVVITGGALRTFAARARAEVVERIDLRPKDDLSVGSWYRHKGTVWMVVKEPDDGVPAWTLRRYDDKGRRCTAFIEPAALATTEEK